MKKYSDLLLSKGFTLNSYPEGNFWELLATDDEKLKQNICKAFQVDTELLDNMAIDINTLILQCAEDFSKCILYYDGNPFDIDTEEFMHCVENI